MEELVGTRLKTAAGNPVAVTAEWTEKVVVTRQPVRDDWIERSLEWTLRAAEDLHVAAVLIGEGVVQYELLPEAPAVRVRLGFSRERAGTWPEWPPDRQVRISLETRACIVVSESLWLDPRADVRTEALAGVQTGSVVTLAEVSGSALTAQIVILGPHDVRITHGRWKADPGALDRLPDNLEFLTAGRRSGRLG